MSKQDFVFTVDARHFQVTSRLHHNKLCTPCAYVRPSVSNGKADFDKVLIFFEKSVANEFNNWMPGYLRQSQTTGRWYAVLRNEDIDCINMGCFNQVRSFLRKAAAKSNDMDSDFPIKHLYFRASDMCNRSLVPKLSGIRECDGAFGDAVYFKFNKEEPEEMGTKKVKTLNDIWSTLTEEQKNAVYYVIGKCLEGKGIKLELPAMTKLSIKKIIFNGPATIVMWNDGSKTVVKCQPGEIMDAEKGIFAACAKKLLGTNISGSNYLEQIKPILMEQCCCISNEEAKKIVGTLDKEER